MIYLMFGIWFVLLLLAGMGLYRLWTAKAGAALVDWLMLPAAIVSEVFYSIGRVVTGRPAFGGIISPRHARDDACRSAIAGRGGLLIGMLSSLLVLAACAAAIGASVYFLDGRAVVRDVVTDELLTEFDLTSLPKDFPTSWNAFWDLAEYQVSVVQRTLHAWSVQDWRRWQTPLLLYLTAIFAIRLGPVRHDQRSSLIVAILLIGIAAAVGAMSKPFDDLVRGDLWSLLTFLWGMVLTMLTITLVVLGIVRLVTLLIPSLGRALPASNEQ